MLPLEKNSKETFKNFWGSSLAYLNEAKEAEEEEELRLWYNYQWCFCRKTKARKVERTGLWGWRGGGGPQGDEPGSNLQEDFLLFRSRVGQQALYLIAHHLCLQSSSSCPQSSCVIPTMAQDHLWEKQSQPSRYITETSNTTGTPRACFG